MTTKRAKDKEQASEAYARMIEGKARFRVVLVTKDGVAEGIRLA